jgi:hypothetical protein
MSLPSFLRIVALMGSENGQQEQVRRLALRAALHDAFDMGEKWLVRGSSFQDEQLKVMPRAAAEWLLRTPMYCHLLPASLAAFLEKPALDDRPRVAAAKDDPQSAAPVIYVTGAPGRPTSMHLIEQEMRMRAAAGEMITPSMRKEAEALSIWLADHHPEAARTTPKTIQNKLSALWRTLGGQSIPKRNDGG